MAFTRQITLLSTLKAAQHAAAPRVEQELTRHSQVCVWTKRNPVMGSLPAYTHDLLLHSTVCFYLAGQPCLLLKFAHVFPLPQERHVALPLLPLHQLTKGALEALLCWQMSRLPPLEVGVCNTEYYVPEVGTQMMFRSLREEGWTGPWKILVSLYYYPNQDHLYLSLI